LETFLPGSVAERRQLRGGAERGCVGLDIDPRAQVYPGGVGRDGLLIGLA